jgi:hypothetical protein
MDGHGDRANPGGANRHEKRDGGGKFTRTLEGAERDAEAARLKAQKWTFQQIADELGYASRSSAYAAVARALAAVPAENVAELRRVSLGEIDFLSAIMLEILDHEHPHVSQGGKIVLDEDGNRLLDDGPKIAAARELRMLNERRGRIQGSDAPVRSKVDIGGDDEREADLRAMIERRRSAGAGGDGERAGS